MFQGVYLTQNILFHWELARGSIWSRGLISLHWIQNPKWGLYHSVDLPLHRAEKGPSPLSAPARSKVEKTKYKVIVVYYYTRLVFGRWWHAGEEVKKQKKKEKRKTKQTKRSSRRLFQLLFRERVLLNMRWAPQGDDNSTWTNGVWTTEVLLEIPPDFSAYRNTNFVQCPHFFLGCPWTTSHLPERVPSLPIPDKISRFPE